MSETAVKEMDEYVFQLEAQIRRLRLENWQLKGALGYEVPGHIPPGLFQCGMCEARALRDKERVNGGPGR